MRKTRELPNTKCELARELWSQIEASGKGYHRIEKELGLGRGAIARIFRGKFSRLITLSRVAREVGMEIRLVPIDREITDVSSVVNVYNSNYSNYLDMVSHLAPTEKTK